MMRPGEELFALSDDPSRDWGALVREFERFQPNLLEQWKKEYECWKHLYSKFRQFEQELLFTAEDPANIPAPDEQLMRFHRRALFALLSSGARCEELLRELPLDADFQQERHSWGKRITTLINSLQESLDTWHKVNAERPENKIAG